MYSQAFFFAMSAYSIDADDFSAAQNRQARSVESEPQRFCVFQGIDTQMGDGVQVETDGQIEQYALARRPGYDHAGARAFQAVQETRALAPKAGGFQLTGLALDFSQARPLARPAIQRFRVAVSGLFQEFFRCRCDDRVFRADFLVDRFRHFSSSIRW